MCELHFAIRKRRVFSGAKTQNSPKPHRTRQSESKKKYGLGCCNGLGVYRCMSSLAGNLTFLRKPRNWEIARKGKFPKVVTSRGGRTRSTQRAKTPLALVWNGVARVVWVVQKTLGRPLLPGSRDLLHPSLTTFGDCPFSANVPDPRLPKPFLCSCPFLGAPKGGCFDQGVVFEIFISRFSCFLWFSWFPRSTAICSILKVFSKWVN